MKILTWSISGAGNKDEELEALIRETGADVCELTETWIRPGQNMHMARGANSGSRKTRQTGGRRCYVGGTRDPLLTD